MNTTAYFQSVSVTKNVSGVLDVQGTGNLRMCAKSRHSSNVNL